MRGTWLLLEVLRCSLLHSHAVYDHHAGAAWVHSPKLVRKNKTVGEVTYVAWGKLAKMYNAER